MKLDPMTEAFLRFAWSFSLSDHLGDACDAVDSLAKVLGIDLSEYEDESGEGLCDLDKLRSVGIDGGLCRHRERLSAALGGGK